jgi:hypothetical protein
LRVEVCIERMFVPKRDEVTQYSEEVAVLRGSPVHGDTTTDFRESQFLGKFLLVLANTDIFGFEYRRTHGRIVPC